MLTRTPLPKYIQEAPELLPGLEFFFEAFFELTGDRAVGMGVLGPIPYSSLRQYAVWHGLEGEDIEEFIFMLRAMDREYLAYNLEEQERTKHTKR